MYVCMYVYVIGRVCLYECMYVCVCICRRMCMCVFVSMYVCRYIYIYVCVGVCVCIRAHGLVDFFMAKAELSKRTPTVPTPNFSPAKKNYKGQP